MKDTSLADRVNILASEGEFEKVVDLLKRTSDSKLSLQICYDTLVSIGILRAIEEYGKVTILDDRQQYERAKRGMEDFPPHAVLYRGPDDVMDGADDMLDFVPEDNPLKQYFQQISQD